MRFPIEDGRVVAPRDYALLAQYLKASESTCVMTFNYDCGLDYALACEDLSINYELEPLGVAHVDLLKMHGSLNWFDDGHQVIEQPIEPIAAAGVSPQFRIGPDTALLSFAPKGNEPFIVPPTASKSDLHRRIWSVWTTASHHLEEAEHIIVCGYSLPDTDRFLHDLFSLAVVAGKRLKSLLVLDKSADKRMRTRYSRLLPAGMRKRLVVARLSFTDVVARLAEGGMDGLNALAGDHAVSQIKIGKSNY